MTELKRFIIVYVSLCLLVGVFASPVFGIRGMGKVYASSDKKEFNAVESAKNIKTTFSKQTIKNVAGSYKSVVGVGIEPFTALMFLGILENFNKLIGNKLNLNPTPAGNIPVLILVIVFWIATKFAKSFEATKILGLVTLGNLEKILGFVFILLLGLLNILGFSDYNISQNASSAAAADNSGFLAGLFAVLFSAFMALVSLAVYFVIKTVFFGIDTIQSFFSLVPPSGLIFEAIKSIIVIVVLTVNIFFPKLGMAINIFIFVICLILVRYFIHAGDLLRILYIKPLFLRIRVPNDEIPLKYSKTPRAVRYYCAKEGLECDLIIPAYSLKMKEADGFKFRFMDKIWLLNTQDGPVLLKKKFRKVERYNLYGKEKKYFFRNRIRFLEIYSNPVEEKPYKKDLRTIISVEYSKRFDEICDKLGFVNYKVYRSNLKLTKKELRLQKKEERKEKIRQKTDAFTYKAAGILRYISQKLSKLNPFGKKKKTVEEDLNL